MESYTIKEARRSQKERKSTAETRAERSNIVHYFSSYDLTETEGKALAMDYYIVRNDKEIIVQQNHLLAEPIAQSKSRNVSEFYKAISLYNFMKIQPHKKQIWHANKQCNLPDCIKTRTVLRNSKTAPVRPIISNIGTATYATSKHLAKLLAPLTKSTYTVKEFIAFTKNAKVRREYDKLCFQSFYQPTSRFHK